MKFFKLNSLPKLLSATLCTTFLATNSFAGEILGISTPYLPSSINIANSRDLISNIILANSSTYLNYSDQNTSNLFRPTKITRNETRTATIWEIEYKENQNLNRVETFDSSIVKNTIKFLAEDYLLAHSATKSFRDSIANIKNLTFRKTEVGFVSRFELTTSDPNFLEVLSKTPLINVDNATILGSERNKSTNLPIYGKYLVEEVVPNSHYALTLNHSYGLGAESNMVSKVRIKKYPDSESRMRAIRSGSIAIIVAPTLREIADAKSDPTLEIITSPFANKNYNMASETLDKSETYDLSHLIVRRSLNPDKNFINFFEFHGLSKSVL